MYIAIRRYQTDPSVVDEVARRVNEEFVPIISSGPGFIAYYALNGGDGTVVSVSVFENEEGAHATGRQAADWVRQSLATLLPNPPERINGEVFAHKGR